MGKRGRQGFVLNVGVIIWGGEGERRGKGGRELDIRDRDCLKTSGQIALQRRETYRDPGTRRRPVTVRTGTDERDRDIA